jgi:nucleotide-binding universal stress UspA family protein
VTTLVIGYDGSEESDNALHRAAALFRDAKARALVAVVWEPGVGFDLMQPTLPPAPIDIRAALEVDEAMYERARQLAEQGAHRARKAGLEADGLAVADELTVAQTLVRLAEERSADGVVIGTHRRNVVSEVLLGSTAREVIHRAPCPVVVVRTNTILQVSVTR